MPKPTEDKIEILPPDHFGVRVESDLDRRLLLCLVNDIGEEKVRRSAARRNRSYPDDLLFVSTLMKRLQWKAPAHVYGPARIPVYHVYLLVLRDHSALKVGMTGRWPARARDFLKTANYRVPTRPVDELFDLDKSVAYPTEGKTEALHIEREIHEKFDASRVASPYTRGLIAYGCRCEREWFDHNTNCAIAAAADKGQGVSLRQALAQEKLLNSLDGSTKSNA